jgi:hypothetical protein
LPASRFPWEEVPAEAPPPAHEAVKAEDEERFVREAYPSLAAVEREAYPTYEQLYGELRRPTPRRPKRSG